MLAAVGMLELDPSRAAGARWARRWRLAPRHARVAAYLMLGKSDKEISAMTGLSLLTVRTYVKVVLRAAGAHNRVELVRQAFAPRKRGRA
jgi:DNA-binding NarL/FixJ family response regulator